MTFDVPSLITDRPTESKSRVVVELRNFWLHEDKMLIFWNAHVISDIEFELISHEGLDIYRLTIDLPYVEIIQGENRIEFRLEKYHERVDPFVSLLRAELMLPDSEGKLDSINNRYAGKLY